MEDTISITPIECASQYGMIVVLKRDGRDSASFELTDVEYTFGRASSCDIRIQVPSIGETHCRLRRNDQGRVHPMSHVSEHLNIE